MRELAYLLEHCVSDGAAAGCGGGGAEAGCGSGGAAAVEVAVVREEQMRTHGGAATEGTAACKNALILGRKVSGLLPPRVARTRHPSQERTDGACEQAST